MPSLNEFHNEYLPKGATLLALSSEGVGVVEKFVESQGIQYAVGIDGGGKAARTYGVTGLPTAFVIDADGEVTWRGHPGNHGELVSAVEAALKEAAVIDLPEDLDRKLSKVADALEEKELGKAWKLASSLAEEQDVAGEQARAIVSSIQELVEKKLAKADAMTGKKAFYDASRLLEKLGGQLDGSDLAAGVEERLKAIDKNDEAADDLKAGKAFEKALKLAAAGKDDKFAEALQGILKKYPDTQVAAKVSKMTEG